MVRLSCIVFLVGDGDTACASCLVFKKKEKEGKKKNRQKHSLVLCVVMRLTLNGRTGFLDGGAVFSEFAPVDAVGVFPVVVRVAAAAAAVTPGIDLLDIPPVAFPEGWPPLGSFVVVCAMALVMDLITLSGMAIGPMMLVIMMIMTLVTGFLFVCFGP